MDNKTLISVIVPIYNVEKYLNQCIESIINQTYTNIEIILIDDGSTDQSLNICKHFCDIDNRIKVVSQENKGVSAARNVGIKLANGEYITFIDGDDIVSENMILTLYNAITNSDIDLVTAGCSYSEEGLMQNQYAFNEFVVNKIQALKLLINNDVILFSSWGKLFKTSKAKNILFDENTGILEDYLFVCAYIANSTLIKVMDNKLYYYVQRDNSALHSEFSPKRLKLIYSYEKSFEIITSVSQKLLPYYRCKFLFELILLKEFMLNCNAKNDFISIVDDKIEEFSHYHISGSIKRVLLVIIYRVIGNLCYPMFKIWRLISKFRNRL